MIVGLIEAMTGEVSNFPDVNMAAARLKHLIGDRHLLLILDDAWSGADLAPFLALPLRMTTTRFSTSRTAVSISREVIIKPPSPKNRRL